MSTFDDYYTYSSNKIKDPIQINERNKIQTLKGREGPISDYLTANIHVPESVDSSYKEIPQFNYNIMVLAVKYRLISKALEIEWALGINSKNFILHMFYPLTKEGTEKVNKMNSEYLTNERKKFEIALEYAGITKEQFFELLGWYLKDPDNDLIGVTQGTILVDRLHCLVAKDAVDLDNAISVGKDFFNNIQSYVSFLAGLTYSDKIRAGNSAVLKYICINCFDPNTCRFYKNSNHIVLNPPKRLISLVFLKLIETTNLPTYYKLFEDVKTKVEKNKSPFIESESNNMLEYLSAYDNINENLVKKTLKQFNVNKRYTDSSIYPLEFDNKNDFVDHMCTKNINCLDNPFRSEDLVNNVLLLLKAKNSEITQEIINNKLKYVVKGYHKTYNLNHPNINVVISEETIPALTIAINNFFKDYPELKK